MNLIDKPTNVDNLHDKDYFMTKEAGRDSYPTPKILGNVSFNNLSKISLNPNPASSPKTEQPEKKKPSQSLLIAPAEKTTVSKSINNEEEECRGTLKKAPKVSKKLPSAFGNIFQKSSGNINNNKLMQPKLGNGSEQISNLDQLVSAGEYKQVTGLLSPIQISKDNKVITTKADDNTVSKKKADKKRHKNPLLPLKNYLLLSKLNEEQIEKSEISIEKLERLSKLQKENHLHKPQASNIPLKLNEMITINVMKSSHETGTVKKMLHAPTFKLYAVKEEPISSRDARNNLKEWITNWQNIFDHSKYHLKIFSTYWNSPEGCVSIIMELMNGGSLQNLLESVGNIPEKAIKSIASNVIMGIEEIHTKLNTPHGCIVPSQILFDRQGNVKISLGISQRTNAQNYMLHSFGRNFEKISLYEVSPINNPTCWQRQLGNIKEPNIDSKLLAHQQDVFDFGFMLLLCAVGGLEFFESNEFADKLKIFVDDLIKKPQDKYKYCCIIHNEDTISSIKLPSPDNTKDPNKLNRSIKQPLGTAKPKHVSIYDFLMTNKFSKEFINFLCLCLKFDPAERYTIKSLQGHPFLVNNRDHKGPGVSLSELLKISMQWTKNYILPPEYQGASDRQLDRLVEALSVVIPNCDRFTASDQSKDYSYFEGLNMGSTVIQELALDLGLPSIKVWRKIDPLIKGLNEQAALSIISDSKYGL